MNVPLLSPLPQQYVSMSSLDARVFCVPLVSIRLLLLGWSLDLCVIIWPIHLQRLRGHNRADEIEPAKYGIITKTILKM